LQTEKKDGPKNMEWDGGLLEVKTKGKSRREKTSIKKREKKSPLGGQEVRVSGEVLQIGRGGGGPPIRERGASKKQKAHRGKGGIVKKRPGAGRIMGRKKKRENRKGQLKGRQKWGGQGPAAGAEAGHQHSLRGPG